MIVLQSLINEMTTMIIMTTTMTTIMTTIRMAMTAATTTTITIKMTIKMATFQNIVDKKQTKNITTSIKQNFYQCQNEKMIVIEASITSKKENNEPINEAEAKHLIAKENKKKVPTEKKEYNESQKVKEQKMKAKIEEI